MMPPFLAILVNRSRTLTFFFKQSGSHKGSSVSFFTLMACRTGCKKGGFLKRKVPHDLFLLVMQPSKTCFSSPGNAGPGGR